MDTEYDDVSLEERAARAREALQARAESAEAASGVPKVDAHSGLCDHYFQAAIAHFSLAALAQDDATFIAHFQTGEAYLRLGEACRQQVGNGPT